MCIHGMWRTLLQLIHLQLINVIFFLQSGMREHNLEKNYMITMLELYRVCHCLTRTGVVVEVRISFSSDLKAYQVLGESTITEY